MPILCVWHIWLQVHACHSSHMTWCPSGSERETLGVSPWPCLSCCCDLSPRHVTQELPGDSPVSAYHLIVGILELWIRTLRGLWHGFWGPELGLFCLHSKCFYILSHLSGFYMSTISFPIFCIKSLLAIPENEEIQFQLDSTSLSPKQWSGETRLSMR